MQLAELHHLHRIDIARRAQDHEPNVTVTLQFGTLMRFDCVLHRKRMQSELRRDPGNL
jgi:hypothetical protein